MTIDRREALKKTAMMMGGALSAPAIFGVLNGCTPAPEPNWQPTFFTPEQAETVMEIVDIIIPQTDTPGAKEIGIPKFVEEMVTTVYPVKDKSEFVRDLIAFDEACDERMGKKFVRLDANKKLSFLMQLNREMQIDFREGKIFGEKLFFWKIKELTLLGYFTSEVGATKVLQHKLVPGQYKGCVSLAEAGGKTWATS